ncbi:MAG TPA: transcriptional repressor [Dehalococcoidia bacterium]|nr:transcriptional repressor [Dehalococcoidia bacterium]
MSELQFIIRKLEGQDYRLTPSRLSVVAAVLAEKGHFTVEDILKRCPGVGRATVFRTIRLLSDMQVLCRVLLEDGKLHYRLSRRGHHHHLVCVDCGKVQDLDRCVINDLLEGLAESTGYTVESHWLEFYGRCQSCRTLDKVPVLS